MEVMLVQEDGEQRILDYQENVWQHSCGSQLFFLHDDGTTQCSRCMKFSTPNWLNERSNRAN